MWCVCLYKSVKAETPSAQSMFITELMLDTKALTYKPSEENFQVSFPTCFTVFVVFSPLIPIYIIILVDSYRRPLRRSLGGLRRQSLQLIHLQPVLLLIQ